MPEFATMSLRPGIGHDAMHDVAHTLMKYKLDTDFDVPTALRHGKSMLPLGHYLRRKLRTMVGKDEKTPEETIEKYRQELQHLRDAAFLASRPFREEILAASQGRRIQLEAHKRRNKRKASI